MSRSKNNGGSEYWIRYKVYATWYEKYDQLVGDWHEQGVLVRKKLEEHMQKEKERHLTATLQKIITPAVEKVYQI